MRILALVVLVGGLSTVGCGDGNDDRSPVAMRTSPAPAPSPARTKLILDGVYDATVVRTGDSFDSIGAVTTNDDGKVSVSVALGNDAGASLNGNVAANGHMLGAGSVSVTDIVFLATGHAAFADDGGVHTVVASIVAPDAYDGFNDTITFSMHRAVDADASVFSGTYRFQFSASPSLTGRPSTAELKLAIGRDGTGTTDATTERTHDGTAVATMSDGYVSQSPEGRLSIGVEYLPTMPDLGGALALIGTIAKSDGGVSASGEAFVGFTPALHVGSWSAERLP